MAKRANVLIIDDDIGFLTALNKLLSRHGHTVASCASPGAALHYVTANSTQFDLVITDLSMPVNNGLRVLQVIQGSFPNLPVIILTAFADAATETRALQDGAHAFLPKPVDEARLLELVVQAADRPREPLRPLANT